MKEKSKNWKSLQQWQ